MVLIETQGPQTVALASLLWFSFGFHLGFTLFPFPVGTAQFIAESGSSKGSGARPCVDSIGAMSRPQLILLELRCPLRLWAKQGVLAVPIQEVK